MVFYFYIFLFFFFNEWILLFFFFFYLSAASSVYKDVIEYQGASKSAEELWPHFASTLDVLDVILGVCFFIELIGKMATLRHDWVKSWWNMFDLVIMTVWLSDRLLGNFEFAPGLLRFLRLMRLVRLIRLVRVLRIFGAIHLITAAIRASLSVLFWSLVVLGLIMGVIAMIISQTLIPYIRDTGEDYETRVKVFEAWGGFMRSMVTMFEITLANWAPSCWLLTNNVDERWCVFFLVYKCTVGFAVVQVILSVFIQQTFKTASFDEDVMIMERQVASKAYLKSIEHLFEVVAMHGDGRLTRERFHAVLENRQVKSWFEALEIDPREAEELFTILANDEDLISKSEFMERVKHVKGAAKAKDLFLIHRDVRRLDRKIDSLVGGVGLDAQATRGDGGETLAAETPPAGEGSSPERELIVGSRSLPGQPMDT
eukprot:NODE_9327_length_1432_cov_2.636782.p1 GENE.NODE_9327_length_1432_cov_2.636782~~NODE_9327_length_1432_cov_2.636782.p1  ORF type:complete len:428 (-),score=98.03 NODE_9327_length_1432_cov_2.636782:67-1350(-)